MKKSRSHWPLSILGALVSIPNVFLPLVLVRILSPDEVGKYKIFFLYLSLVPWFCLSAGINNGLSHWGGHEHKRESAYRSSWTLLVAISSLSLAIGLIAKAKLALWLGWPVHHVNLFLWGIFVTILGTFFDDATVAQGKIWRGAIFSSVSDLLRVGSILASALIFRSIEAIFVAHLSLISLKVVIGAIWGGTDGFQRLKWDPETARAVMRYALPVSLSAALSIISGYSDQILLSQRLSAADFAMYSLGCLLVPPLAIFEQSVNKVLIPRMAKEFVENRSHAAMVLFRDAVSELSWILIPAALGMILFAEPIVVLLFTEKFLPAAFFLRIFAVNHLANLLPNDVVARARGNGRWILSQLMIFSALSVVAVYVGITAFGAAGALGALTLIGFAMRWSAAAYNHKVLGWPFKQMLPWADWRRYVLSGSVATLAGWSLRVPTGGGLRWLLVGGGAFTIVYFAGTYKTFLRRRAENKKPAELHLPEGARLATSGAAR